MAFLHNYNLLQLLLLMWLHHKSVLPRAFAGGWTDFSVGSMVGLFGQDLYRKKGTP
ncbi:hypothetical protein [Mangrovibacterium marinum]|uniref:hypothetical protein n=1 Tax=Mangrovibacterium marinum TaxID=1639118 RepID=UPI0014759222|nr:hypothetical protein [Mangrovibacterium marinum]